MRFFYVAICILLLASCNNRQGKPDVSNIPVDLKIFRFDQDFFSIDTSHLSTSLDTLYRKYPSFLPLYFEYLTPVNFMVHEQGKTYPAAVLEYYRIMRSLYDSVQSKYRDLAPVRKELEKGMRYIKYYYPSFAVPPVYTTVEGLNPEDPQEIYGTSYYHDTLVISLQMFMGNNFPGYDPTRYFDYIRRRFEAPYIAPNGIRAIANALYPDSSSDAPLIVQMVEKGKQWYLLDHLLPDAPDSLKTFYTEAQLQWCRDNEGNIWGSILSNTPDLYTQDKERIQNYLGEAPFTQDMPHEASPGNIGQWVGWRIVQKFAAKNPDMSVHQVLATPARKIFQEAGYRPK